MELPYDELVHIFKYLSKFDRLSASETCRSWHEAANDHYFLKNKIVMFYDQILKIETLSPLHAFEDSTIPYCHYTFSDINITDKFNNFWRKKGYAIRTLTLEYCHIRRREFIFMLQKCTNLESLNIQDGCVEFQNVQPFDEDLLDNSLKELKKIILSYVRDLTDALLTRLMSAAPALEELDLGADSLHFLFNILLQLISSKAKKIKHLKFHSASNSLIDSASLQSLLETENLKLETLYITSYFYKEFNLAPLTTHQVYLKELCLNFCSNVSDRLLIDICKNIVNLEHLDIARCQITDLGIKELQNIKNLKYLNVSSCLGISQDGLIGGICSKVNVILEVLDVGDLNLDQNAVITISERLPNLRNLSLYYCHEGVTDCSLQYIFKNQLLLHTLNIYGCDKVTDAGLTGIKIVEPDGYYEHDRLLSNFHQSPAKRTKVEKEIDYVGEQKLGIIFCAKRIVDTGYSLSHLKHLKELNIGYCENITDVSLAHAFNLNRLIKLSLGPCIKVTRKGLECLVNSCPNIEDLYILFSGSRINVHEVKETVKCLKWLKRLTFGSKYIRARRPDGEIIFEYVEHVTE